LADKERKVYPKADFIAKWIAARQDAKAFGHGDEFIAYNADLQWGAENNAVEEMRKEMADYDLSLLTTDQAVNSWLAQATRPTKRIKRKKRERQTDVLRLYREGDTAQDMAEHLAVSVATIRRDLRELGLKERK
jgi:hypothetical protein